MKNSYVLIGSLILILSASETTASNPEKSTRNSSLLVTKALPVPQFGVGYSRDLQHYLNQVCLKIDTNQIVYDGVKEHVIQLGDAKSFYEIQKDLNVDVTSSSKIGLFSEESSANYARHIRDTEYSESFYYLDKIKLPTKIASMKWGENNLNDFGKGAYQAGPELFRIACGDEFIQQELLGANLFVTMKINFANHQDKVQFDASVQGGIGNYGKASATIKRIVNTSNIKGSLEISAYQLGGDANNLANIFTKNNCKTHYCAVSCSLENLDACQSTIDGILDYAQNNYPEQLQVNSNGKPSDNAAPIEYVHQDYKYIGLLNTEEKELPLEVEFAREKLGNLYKKQLKNYEFLSHLLSSSIAPNIEYNSKISLEEASNALLYNIQLLENVHSGALGCFLTPNKCVDIEKNILSRIKSYNESLLEHFKTSFRLAEGYAIPLGGNLYTYYYTSPSPHHLLDRLSLEYNNDQSKIFIEGVANGGMHFTGVLYKTPGTSTYRGNYKFDDGHIINVNYTKVKFNPI